MDDDRVAIRKRANMNKRFNKIYQDMDSVDTERIECQKRLEAVEEQPLNEQKIFKILLEFDRIYDNLSLEEKRSVLHSLISEIQIYNKDEIMESKTYVKKIRFAFDIFNIDENLDDESNNVETVCLLSKLRKAKHHVSVTLDMDEMDLTSAESKAVYEEIKRYMAGK